MLTHQCVSPGKVPTNTPETWLTARASDLLKDPPNERPAAKLGPGFLGQDMRVTPVSFPVLLHAAHVQHLPCVRMTQKVLDL